MVEDTVQQIKDRLSITDVVSQYVKLERAGANLRAKCPLHAEKTPSFFISPERGSYHCFGCDKGGDIFTFVQEIEGVDFKGALTMLAERAGVPLVFSKREPRDARDRLYELLEAAVIFYVSRLTDDARAYLKKRGLSDMTVMAFRIGLAGDGWSDACDHLRGKKFSEKELLDAGVAKKGERGIADKFRNRIIFPLADSAGRVIGFSGRTFGKEAHPDAPKYLNSPETALFKKSRFLYGFDRAKQAMRKHNFAILVEGQMDLLLSHEAGFTNTVAVSGTAFTEEHARLLRRMTDNLLIALDADAAGIKAAARASRVALRAGLHVKVAPLPDGLDPADIISTRGKDAWRAAIRDSKDIVTFFLDATEARVKDENAFRRAVEIAVLPFLHDVDSPLDREHYLQEIARRLRVSETAVREALSRIPKEPAYAEPDNEPLPTAPASLPRQAEEAYATLVWQQSAKRPGLDVAQYKKALEEALGVELWSALEAMPRERLEPLCFTVSELFKDARSLKHYEEKSIVALTRERLSRERTVVAQKLRKAEEGGEEALVQQLLEKSKVLTKRIAELAKEV